MQIMNDLVSSLKKLSVKSTSKQNSLTTISSKTNFDDCVNSSKVTIDKSQVSKRKIYSDTKKSNSQGEDKENIKIDKSKQSEVSNKDTSVNSKNFDTDLDEVDNKQSKAKLQDSKDDVFELLQIILKDNPEILTKLRNEILNNDLEGLNSNLGTDTSQDFAKNNEKIINDILLQLNSIGSISNGLHKLTGINEALGSSNATNEQNIAFMLKNLVLKSNLNLGENELKALTNALNGEGDKATFEKKILDLLKDLDPSLIKDKLASIKEGTLNNKFFQAEKSIDANEIVTDGEFKSNILTGNNSASKNESSQANNESSNSSFEVKGNTLKSNAIDTKQNNFINIMQQNDAVNKVSMVEAKEIANITKPQDIIEVTVNKFKALRLPELTELRVKLNPEELGEITVRLVLEKGKVNGNISADNKEVVNVIQNSMDNLKEQIKNNNVNLNNLSVNIGSQDDFSDRHGASQFSGQNKNNNNNRNVEEVFTDNIKEDEQEQGLNIIA